MKKIICLLLLFSCASKPIVREVVKKETTFPFDPELDLRLVKGQQEIKIKNDRFVFQDREEKIVRTKALPYKSFTFFCKEDLAIGVVMETLYHTELGEYQVSHWIGQCGDEEIACAYMNGVNYLAYTNLSQGNCPKKNRIN